MFNWENNFFKRSIINTFELLTIDSVKSISLVNGLNLDIFLHDIATSIKLLYEHETLDKKSRET